MDPSVVERLVREIEVKDLSTAAHTWRVVLYARALAEEAGFDHDMIRRITHAAALHDVGKLDIPGAILQKPGPLTADEFEVIKTHASRGHERLVAMGEDDPVVLEFVRHHHERWDGGGYPDALAGEAIPIGARFFAVVDSFDALTSIRPYRSDVGPDAAERALVELKAGVGTRYWREAVDGFAALYRAGRLDWILHHFNDDRCDLPAYQGAASAVRVAHALGT